VRIIFGVLCGVAIILSLGPLPRHPRYRRGSRCHISRSLCGSGWAGMRVPARFAAPGRVGCYSAGRPWSDLDRANVSPGQDASNAGTLGFPRSCPSRWPRCSSVSWE
jgi:hypothetical protein